MNEPAIIRVIKAIEKEQHRGPYQVGEEMEITDGTYGQKGIEVYLPSTHSHRAGWLKPDEYELVSGKIPIRESTSTISSTQYPRNPQQIRMNRAASRYGKRVRRGGTVVY